MKQVGKIIGSSLLSLLLLLGLVFSMQNAVPVLQSLTVAANDITSHPAKGEVSGNGVYGYTTDYVCNGGPMQEEHAVQNGWHITAKNTYYAYGILWYECWDTDDGDYYGWIDANYLSFYDTTPAPAQTQAPKQTVIVEKTVLVTEPPKETVIVEKTILVTESPTEPSTETKEQTTTKAAAAINLDDQSKNNASPLENVNLQLILIGAGILILAGVSIGLIILFVKKSKEKPAGSVQMSQLHNPWEESNSPMNPYAGQNSVSSNKQQTSGLICPNCGAVCHDPDGKFCDQCGTPLK